MTTTPTPGRVTGVSTDPLDSAHYLDHRPTRTGLQAAALAFLRRHDALDLAPMLGLDRMTAAHVAVAKDDLALLLAARGSGHAHAKPGIWDWDNGPGVAGVACTFCPVYDRLASAAGILPREVPRP